MFSNRGISGTVCKRQQHVVVGLWIVFYCYAVCAALIFQKVLLLTPSMHAVGGFFSKDAIYFDSVASLLAEQIRLHGWSAWQLYPATGASGNVAILGALYAVFGHDPALIIPINAAMHALGGVLIYLIARELSGRETIGTYAGVIASSLFVIFPSALNWYGQIHKDGYAIAGTLLILLTWVRAVSRQFDIRGWLMLALGQVVGVALVASVRPYNLKLLLIATLGAGAAIFVVALIRRQLGCRIRLVVFFLFAAISLAGGIKEVSDLAARIKEAKEISIDVQTGDSYSSWTGNGQWQWKESTWLPDGIENYLKIAAKTRAALIDFGVKTKAKSMIDNGIAPQSVGEVAAYLPRALQVALFAPFPASWLVDVSMTRLVAAGEMFIYYLCIPGVFLLLLYNRRPAVLLAIYFACFFLMIYGFTIANVGSLYRLRYGYLFVILSMGVLGWFTWLENSGRLKRLIGLLKPPSQLTKLGEMSHAKPQQARREVVGAGFFVIGITFLCFLGFFLRDIMMAHTFGLGAGLDNFFVALLIPMFVVTVLSIPLGTAFIPVYLEGKERFSSLAVRTLVSNVSFWMTVSLLAICLILALILPYLLPLLKFRILSTDITQLNSLLYLALPVLLLSGVVVLGNSVLNAHGRFALTSAAQLVVPITAILALVLFGSAFGVKAVMVGMVLGQLLNLLIVQFFLKRYHVSLLPRKGLVNQAGFSPLLTQYLPLVVSALFISAAAPVATLLAMSLPEGGVSAFNLGNKVVLFVTGLVGAAVSTVMLPYFSSLVVKNHLVSARRELSFFLLFSTFISVPVSAGLFVWSEPIVRLLFEGGSFDADATGLVTRVMQYAVVQLPFFVSNSLLLKFAAATKHVVAVSVVAIAGLLVNVGASILLMKHMGVAGIALGSSMSMLVSTVLLVLVLVRYWHITWVDAVIMLLNWLLFVTLLVSFHFQSAPGIFVTVLSYAILLSGYFRSLRDDRLSGIELRN